MAAIELDGISKRFGRGAGAVDALTDLSLLVPAGGIYGLLGPNGAGKSTLLRIVAGLVFADRGSVRLFGAPTTIAARRRLGMLVEGPGLYPFLTARQMLAVLARTSGARPDLAALLRRVGLEAAADRRIAGFSLGMRQRLGIAAALVAGPDILILDEPANGLDPAGIVEMRHLLKALAEEGMTILVSSHLLDEVERTCDRVAILNRGRLAAEGEVAMLLGAGARLWLDAAPVEAVLARVGDRGLAEKGGVAVKIERSEAPALLAALAADGVALFEARWLRGELETLFFDQTGDGA
jgi:ABC-2 type transport system ATP-binding protein